jgi:AcrR family transcriptional regulator
VEGWVREDRPDQAVEKILDAAGKVFVEQGVASAGMSQVAEAAGCSRGTLYRYFKSRHELHLAYVQRATLEIVERVRAAVAGIDDPRERLIEYILCSLREVRGEPATAAWFAPGAADVGARMSRSAEVVERVTTAFVSEALGPPRSDPDVQLRARWFVRVVVSLLSDPGESDEEERALIERFVAPALL